MKSVPVEVFLAGAYAEEIIEQLGPKGPIYIARYRKMPGCMAQGRSRTEALVTLRKTREPYIRAIHTAGGNIPLPDFDSAPLVLVGGVTLTAGQPAAHAEQAEADLGSMVPPIVEEQFTTMELQPA